MGDQATLNPILEDFWLEPARNKVLYGGRFSSKSWDAAGFSFFLADNYKLRILCAHQFQNKIEESVYSLLKVQIERFGLKDRFRVLNNKIENIYTGSEFLFYGLWRNIDEIKSLEGVDICWLEEAHNVSKEQWEILEPTIRKEYSQFWIIFNPKLTIDFVYRRFVTSPPPNTVVRKINYPDNPFLSQTALSDMFGRLRTRFDNYIAEVSKPLATKIVIDVMQEVDSQIANHTKSVIGVDLPPFYQTSDIQSTVDYNIDANVALIKSIPQQYAQKLEALVLNALQTGQTNAELAKEIHKLGQSTESRARLIAADQMGKINSNINKQRQLDLGVESYTWQTAKDERVRTDHKNKQGKTFRWDEPPSGGHPGEPIGCRCVALPNYDDILVD